MSDTSLHFLDDSEIDSLENHIGYCFKNRSLADTAFTDVATARRINSERRPGRYINDNEPLAYVGKTAIDCLNTLIRLKPEVYGNHIQEIDDDIHINDRFLLPLMGAIAIDCCWDTATMIDIANRLFVPVRRQEMPDGVKATD